MGPGRHCAPQHKTGLKSPDITAVCCPRPGSSTWMKRLPSVETAMARRRASRILMRSMAAVYCVSRGATCLLSACRAPRALAGVQPGHAPVKPAPAWAGEAGAGPMQGACSWQTVVLLACSWGALA